MATTQKFNAGDLVRVKSGGPVMTVLDYDTNGYVVCQWFDENDNPSTDTFGEIVLELVEESNAN